jgi:hypothetical protein
VETGGLNEFAGDVGFYATEVDSPAAHRSRRQFDQGVTFGVHNASSAVLAAKERYAASVDVSLRNLTEFVEAAKILAAAAEKVAADFDAVDAGSADAASRVNGLLNTAIQETRGWSARTFGRRCDQPAA